MEVPGGKKERETETFGKNNNRNIFKFNESSKSTYPRISVNSKQHKHTHTPKKLRHIAIRLLKIIEKWKDHMNIVLCAIMELNENKGHISCPKNGV